MKLQTLILVVCIASCGKKLNLKTHVKLSDKTNETSCSNVAGVDPITCVPFKGCTNPIFDNYDPNAKEDDGSCECQWPKVLSADETRCELADIPDPVPECDCSRPNAGPFEQCVVSTSVSPYTQEWDFMGYYNTNCTSESSDQNNAEPEVDVPLE